jgi:DNA-directed RNA polymerase alpha subunit
MGKKSTVPPHHHNYGSLEAAVDINTKATEALTTAVQELLRLIHTEMAKDAEREVTPKVDNRLGLGIDSLHLTIRTYNLLKRESIHTVGELVMWNETDLFALRNFGIASIDDTKDALEKLNLHLKDAYGCTVRCGIHNAKVSG